MSEYSVEAATTSDFAVSTEAAKKNEKFVVQRSKINGALKVSGAKNSVLYLLTASLLTDDAVYIDNYPRYLLDAQVHLDMLEQLGKSYEIQGDQVAIRTTGEAVTTLDWHGRSIRNTLLILGALTARHGKGAVPLPGGCKLGERGFDIHEMLLKKMGATMWEEEGMLCAEAPGGLVGTDIHLPLRSTGATHNGIICGTVARGTTRIWNPHLRPETVDLVNYLRSMGAEINIYGQEHIEIVGKEGLFGTRYKVMSDNMEALTWLICSVITGGDVEIQNFPYRELEVPLIFLRESGAKFYRGEEGLIVRGGTCYPLEISTGPYPGINSDMQPLFAVYGAMAKGQTKIVDLRFPGRYAYGDELNKLGADCQVCGNMLVINGGSKLAGAEVRAVDLRGGIALALAGLCADGETVISDAWQVERGYNDFVRKLTSVGGRISYA